jgi:hypothetical protein
MKKRPVAAICGFLLILLQYNPAVAIETKEIVSVNMLNDQKLLSIDAQNTALDVIIKNLAEQCNVTLKISGKGLPAVLLTVQYKNLSIAEALQNILRAGGVTNYILDEKYDSSKRLSFVDCRILTCETKARTDMLPTAEFRKPIQVADISPDNHMERVEFFKQKHNWANDEVKDLAGHLLEIMPEQIREGGINALDKILDGKKKNKDLQSIDENTLVQSIIDTAPPEMGSIMKGYLQQYIQNFKGKGDGIIDKTPNEQYQKAVSKGKQPAI